MDQCIRDSDSGYGELDGPPDMGDARNALAVRKSWIINHREEASLDTGRRPVWRLIRAPDQWGGDAHTPKVRTMELPNCWGIITFSRQAPT
jgi:hypothetical protein